MRDLTVIAIDWSGAKSEGKLPGIWVTAMRGGEVAVNRRGWSRKTAVDFVMEQESPVVVGFDFSFGLPSWHACELGCSTIRDVWELAASEGDDWLKPTPPFWNAKCVVAPDLQLRATEERVWRTCGVKPASVFALVGPKQVGCGSVRGMPHLSTLRRAGFSVWPFDDPSERVAVEIYPSLYAKLFPAYIPADIANRDELAARVSARTMSEHRSEFAQLRRATDERASIEGEIWAPASNNPRSSPATEGRGSEAASPTRASAR